VSLVLAPHSRLVLGVWWPARSCRLPVLLIRLKPTTSEGETPAIRYSQTCPLLTTLNRALAFSYNRHNYPSRKNQSPNQCPLVSPNGARVT